jgi:hypothetical protein
MPQISDELLKWADFLAKFGQFLFGLCSLSLAVWAATFKRKDFFRSELAKKQLNELGETRTALQSIFFNLYYIPHIEQILKAMGWSLDSLKENDPDSWEQYQRYKSTSFELFYKFSDANYYLFPSWIDKERRKAFAEAMRAFAPFTLHATASKTAAEREAYATEIIKIKDYLDSALQKNT